MKGLFQCPPWARSFCPFMACGANLLSIIHGVWSQLAKHYSGRVEPNLRNLILSV